MMSTIGQWIRAAFRRTTLDREMTDEMQQHLDRATERLMRRGLALSEASSAARREFGNVGTLQEEGREARGTAWIESLLSDLRYAVRGLRASPVFATVAILSLAIGIGANTAIFSLINAVMLKSLPVERPGELVQVKIFDAKTLGTDNGSASFTNPMWEALRDEASGLSGFAVAGGAQFDLADGGEARVVNGNWVNGDYFTTLGVRPAAGRLFRREDDVRGCTPTVVLSYGFWQSEFGGRAKVIGTSLRASNHSYTVIGVTPASFTGIDVGTEQKLYIPICASSAHNLTSRSSWWLRVLGRPARGTSLAQASARLDAASKGVFETTIPEDWDAKSKADYANRRFGATPAGNGVSDVRRKYSSALFALMGMVSLILLISCANVANLLLARGVARGRETAIRLAIGASRARLLRQNLTEGLVLATIGSGVGMVLAQWGSRILVALLGNDANTRVALDLSLDVRVLAFTVIAGVVTVLVFALVPSWRATRIDPQVAMKSGGRSMSDGRARFAIGKALVVAQCALALILVMGAGPLLGSFARLTTLDPGFRADGVMVASVEMSRAALDPAGYRLAQQRLLEEMRAQPGLHDASVSNLTPVSGSTWNDLVMAEGVETAESDRIVWFNRVSDGFFHTMGTRLVAGRDFSSADDIGAPQSAIVNRAAVKRYFKDASPIGRVLRTVQNGKPGSPMTVVGVVEDAKYESLREKATPTVYLAMSQDSSAGASAAYEIRVEQSPSVAVAQVRVLVQRVDARFSLQFAPLSDQLAQSLIRERMLAVLSAFFGGLALLLAMIGLYGVMAYMVTRRRVEIGIRVALGAARGRIVGLVLGDVFRMMAVGVALGGVGAFVLGRLLTTFLYGVTPNDPRTLLVAVAVLSVAALAAGAIPARRAATLEPVEALRED